MGCGDGCLLNDEGYRAIEGSSRPPLINLTVPAKAGEVDRISLLAHTVRNPTEAAYACSDLFERRCRLMDDWAAYLVRERQAQDSSWR